MIRACLALALAVVACQQEPSRLDPVLAGRPTPTPKPAVTAPKPAPKPAVSAASGDAITGTVVETINAAGYTYAKLDRDGTEIWVAGPETKLAVGTKLGKLTGSLMPGFHSDTLNRTFDEIYFINDFGLGAAPKPAVAVAPVTTEKVAPAAGGKTIAEVFAAKDTLSGKPVVVRGKVVKLNTGIMGRNWVHLRDGTGTTGTDDLLITTDDTAELGDIVVVRGTVATHQDFGAGYKYDLLVEKAKLASK